MWKFFSYSELDEPLLTEFAKDLRTLARNAVVVIHHVSKRQTTMKPRRRKQLDRICRRRRHVLILANGPQGPTLYGTLPRRSSSYLDLAGNLRISVHVIGNAYRE
jgi:hypothetical protein